MSTVVVPEFLSEKLRSHQREGVQFLYECTMGIKNGPSQTGCILADEVGVGKVEQYTLSFFVSLFVVNLHLFILGHFRHEDASNDRCHLHSFEHGPNGESPRHS